MGKSFKGYNDDNQRLKRENKKLKLQVGKLRKVIKNIDVEHYNFVQDLLDSSTFAEPVDSRVQEKLEKQWSCHKCEDGIMRLVILHRAGEPYYMRKCDVCENKTKMQKYQEGVEGV